MYRQRSDPDLIEKIYGLAHARGALTILDIQVGKSTIDSELPLLLPFLQRPDVHLGIDPEFYMHHNREGRVPGEKIGAMDAATSTTRSINSPRLVTKYHLPPKVLVVHRFTTNMLQNASSIKLDPRVQVVINMDGWGQPWLKFDTYKTCEVDEPVQFTGFKLFFHNDTRKGDALLSPQRSARAAAAADVHPVSVRDRALPLSRWACSAPVLWLSPAFGSTFAAPGTPRRASAGLADAARRDAPAAGSSRAARPTEVTMRNVDFHIADGIVLRIRRLVRADARQGRHHRLRRPQRAT